MKKIIPILLVGIVIAYFMVCQGGSFSCPSDVTAADIKVCKDCPDYSKLKIGDKIKVGKYESTFTGKSKNKYNFKMVFDAPMYLDNGTLLKTEWINTGTNKYTTKDNIFNATVDGNKVSISYKTETYSYNSELYIDGKLNKENSPDLMPYDPINVNYAKNTVYWYYGDGTFRNLRQIEGVLQDLYTFDKAPKGDIVIKDIATKSSKFNFNTPAFAYDKNNKPIKVTEVNGIKTVKLSDLQGVVYPITIDPSSTYYTSSSDGYTTGYDANYTTAHDLTVSSDAPNTGSVVGLIGQDKTAFYQIVRRHGYYFDTSDIPDGSTITSATLSLYGYFDQSDTDFLVTIQTGGGTYPHDPMVSADYNKVNYSSGGGTYDTVGGWSTVAYNAINLNATGLTWIDTDGITKLCLRSDHDINSIQNAGNEVVYSYTYEQGAGFRPKLEVTYTSTPPTTTTQAASNVGSSSAQLNAFIDSEGTGNVTVWFGYDVHSHSCNISAYAYTVNATGYWGTGSYPSANTGTLTCNTTYYFCAEASNDAGSDTGGELTFTTSACPLSSDAPSNFVGNSTCDTIKITWTKAAGCDYTLIRYGAGCGDSCPVTSNSTGTVSYNGTLTYDTITGLDSGSTYCFYAWGWTTGNYTLTSNISFCLTTLPCGAEDDSIPPPTMPTNWFMSTDYTTQADNPLYDTINDLADYYGTPRNNAWMGLALLISVIIAGLVLATSKNMWIAMAALLALMIIGTTMKLIPLWVTGITGIALLSLIVFMRRGVTE